MSLITTADAKLFLGIEIGDTDSDTAIAQLIPKAEALFYSFIKVDTLEEKTKDEIAIVKDRDIWFTNFPIVSINNIDGETYSGVSWDDYIATKNKVKFVEPDFLSKVKFGKIKVNYSSGYAPELIPEDLKLAILILVAGFYNLKENYGVTTCKIGQESMNFRDVTEGEDFNRILKTYKKKFIFVI